MSSISEQESQAFAEMYRSIFSQPSPPIHPTRSAPDAAGSAQQEAATQTEVQSGSRPSADPLGSFFRRAEKRNQLLKDGVLTPSGQLRSRSSVLLEEKVAEVESCRNDWELLKWADGLFATQREMEIATRSEMALKAGSKRKSSKKGKSKEPNVENSDSTQAVATETQVTNGLDSLTRSTHLRVYPLLLSLLMRTFRERYADPFISLSLFHNARRLSVFSYVYGCTTPVYNELLDTLWTCFRDLEGFLKALREMEVNGVEFDGRTRAIVEKITTEGAGGRSWSDWDGEELAKLGKMRQMVGLDLVGRRSRGRE
ncbi:hypothetical protein M407DRAFT_24754 [Tulasnella calospora MUT 4182]|uniref:Mtf2-like C-terminal domain-containing protein n=1 Tax=Tulasnella calospora MUT 4182 TaxID=1051891 RepID=A0A0C3QHB3_9AGAM|nr:hypothetical protein M407DRAFT_24754 [Tulasnella calospora MUT 4182]